ncbi:hypothetical protein TMatcc_003078 [Talaromyces marneffei ATCC 18224]|uniref:Ribosome biogenesis protein Alb1 n=1 Tax=Talaromyces marneffei (strain ATCC 18224 / CBS 334.59 / QM 7333) TaxID=441960 RepID=B6Q6A4_TALMQ|nr:uncharacterized protein EYB26_001859 [Talaromyces marneffei]EEA28579.1 conserved hypothetical protein [Talaromyces marneffei ATCC 18224]KAE8555799.1 hypothetical protein EYB25_000497 [Talaromyces marneffei]QGA14206.1 hypothetical protein EYB26_001859 [Talaromyces marneffei]
MVRTGKLKKKSTSVHSRAARRGNSPSDVDRSLESMSRVEAPTKAAGVLAAHANAGISKKKATKKLTRSQRLRQQKGIERGEMLFDRLETKVEKAKTSYSKVANARKVQWEDLSGKQAKAAKILQQTQHNDDERMEEDEKVSSAAPITSNKPAFTTPVASSLPPVEPAAVDDDDNIT